MLNNLSASQIIFIKALLLLIYLVTFLAPGFVFFSNRGGFGFLEDVGTLKELSLHLFPLFGLYAFFFVWSQTLVGSNLSLLVRIFRGVRKFHMNQGKIAFIFALLHPNLLILSIGISEYFKFEFVDPTLKTYLFFGVTAYYLLIITVVTALLMRLSFLRRVWKYVHLLNYVIFILVWFHSWYLGSDVQPTNLKYLWVFFGITGAFSLVYRIIRAIEKPKQSLIQIPTNT